MFFRIITPLKQTFATLGDQENKLEDLRGRIVVYSIIGCPHCLAAKQTLRENHLPFVDVSIDRFPERLVIMMKKLWYSIIFQPY